MKHIISASLLIAALSVPTVHGMDAVKSAASSATTSVAKAGSAAANAVSGAAKGTTSLIRSLGTSFSNAANSARTRAVAFKDTVVTKGSETFSSARNSAVTGFTDARNYAKANPGKATAIGVAVVAVTAATVWLVSKLFSKSAPKRAGKHPRIVS